MTLKMKSMRSALLLAFMMFVGSICAQTVKVNVKDSQGEPVIGASVVEQDTKNGGITDFDGNFTIKLTANKPIVISYIGMKSQTIDTKGKSEISVTLAEDNTTLQDVVVVGYGTVKKTDLTGSVSSVNTEQLNAKGSPSVVGSLQGSNPGVNITQTSGRAGSGFNVEIRGKSSVEAKTTPLFVVDGVMCDDIDWLNPQDIERIDVLKDASSTAIYGSRATAGVVMVTTKGGLSASVKRVEKPTISYDGYYGWVKAARMPDFMNAQEFYNYRFLKFLTYGGNGATVSVANPTYTIGKDAYEQCMLADAAGSTNYILKNRLASGMDVDWPNEVLRTGSQQNHFIAINGSSEKINYHFGVGFNQEKGLYENDEMKRFNFKGSLDAKVSNVISAGFTVNLAKTDNTYANDDAIREAFRMNPFINPYDANGNVIHQPGLNTALGTAGNQFTSQRNPLDVMKSTKKERETWRALGNFYLKFDIIKGLDFKTTFSPSYTYYRQGFFGGYINDATGTAYDDATYANGANEVNLTNNRSFSWVWDNIINYNTRFGEDHSLSVMALYSCEAGNTEKTYWAGTDTMAKTDWYNMKSSTFNKDDSYTSYSETSMTSWALRANYGYKDRYLLTATIRWDGSSKFAKDNRWGTFPSVAAAWRITEESFMKNIDWLSNLKLRLSYGVTGNNTPNGAYDTQQTVSGPAYYPFAGVYAAGYYPSGIVNKDLKWETSTEWNAGLDFGFLRNRISGSIDVYRKTSKDLLYQVDLPLVSGGGKMWTNVGSVRNTGIEFSLTTVNIENKDWRWETTLNFSHNHNKVLEINGTGDRIISTSDPTTSSKFVGEAYNNIYAYEWGGIVSDRMMTAPNNLATIQAGITPGTPMREYDYYYQVYGLTEGQPYVIDQNGDGTIDINDRVIKSADPTIMGSFTSNLSWKDWDFSFSLYAKLGSKAYSNFLNQYGDLSDRGRVRLQEDWYIPAGTLIHCDGINADGTYINPVYQQTTHYGEYPFPNNGGTAGGVGTQADFYNVARCVVNNSFLKVKYITLGYTFPKSIISKFGCKHLRLYATVTNPFVFTKYKGFDPEWADASLKNDGPSTVTYQIGASIKF